MQTTLAQWWAVCGLLVECYSKLFLSCCYAVARVFTVIFTSWVNRTLTCINNYNPALCWERVYLSRFNLFTCRFVHPSMPICVKTRWQCVCVCNFDLMLNIIQTLSIAHQRWICKVFMSGQFHLIQPNICLVDLQLMALLLFKLFPVWSQLFSTFSLLYWIA